MKVQFVDKVVADISLRLRQLNVVVESKTFDDVFVKVSLAVQYLVNRDDVAKAYYSLTDVDAQMSAFVENVVADISLRLRQLNVVVESKTFDDVFVKVSLAVQY